MNAPATISTGGGTSPEGTVVIDRVTKAYSGHVAVDDLSLDIRAGEFLSLLGPSGCGKTTTLRMIAGFERPDAGDIRISGQSVLDQPPYKRNVNTVFQAYALFPHMTVAQNVAYGLQQKRTPKEEIRERVASALELVQMRHLAERRPTQLSGGQQQRVALARALVNRPAVLLLDEPLGALDRQLREEMQVELKLLQSDLGITFVFVTHDQEEALSMSDRIAIMRAGRIEQLGDADTIYARPASAYVAAFVGQQNFMRGTVADGGAAVSTPHALVRGPEPLLNGLREGQAAVRPEFINIGKDAGSDAGSSSGGEANSLRGEVIGISHLGDSMQYVVRTASGGSILVRRPTADAPDVEVEDRVRCSWRADHVLLYPVEGSESAPAPDAGV